MKNKHDSGIQFMSTACGIDIVMKEKIEYWLNQMKYEFASIWIFFCHLYLTALVS